MTYICQMWIFASSCANISRPIKLLPQPHGTLQHNFKAENEELEARAMKQCTLKKSI